MYFFTYKDSTLSCYLDNSKHPLFQYKNISNLYYNDGNIKINKDKLLNSNLYSFIYYSSYLEHKDREYVYTFFLNKKYQNMKNIYYQVG